MGWPGRAMAKAFAPWVRHCSPHASPVDCPHLVFVFIQGTSAQSGNQILSGEQSADGLVAIKQALLSHV